MYIWNFHEQFSLYKSTTSFKRKQNNIPLLSFKFWTITRAMCFVKYIGILYELQGFAHKYMY